MRTNYLKNEGVVSKVLVKSKIDSTEFTNITVKHMGQIKLIEACQYITPRNRKSDGLIYG